MKTVNSILEFTTGGTFNSVYELTTAGVTV